MRAEREERFATHFSRFLGDKSGLEGEAKVFFEAILDRLIISLDEGDSCLELNNEELQWLPKTQLLAVISQQNGKSMPDAPLVLFGTRLYLHRYFSYEKNLAQRIRAMAEKVIEETDLSAPLDALFGAECKDDGEMLQRKAAELAGLRCLSIISGGPGTGKTTTAAKIIALLLRIAKEPYRIALAAPTGKAAIRLQHSLENARAFLFGGQEILGFPEQATTLHRLLGMRSNSTYFRHNQENPLDYDVVVVDEASMVDLAMMTKLVSALKKECRLILLGDKDQLSSVESGAVLADMIENLLDNTVVLQKTYRFKDSIKKVAEAVNAGDGLMALNLFKNDKSDTLSFIGENVFYHLFRGYNKYFSAVKEREFGNYAHIFEVFEQFRVLCATRVGPFGVVSINRVLENLLQKKLGWYGLWYPGRPVIVVRNDYSHGLFNGDVGICLEDSSGALRVWFDGGPEGWKVLLPSRLPQHMSSFAITVHKSQGSEFEEVALVFPDEEMRHLTRELVYTGITRAKERVRVCADENYFVTAISRKTMRGSGLGELLSS